MKTGISLLLAALLFVSANTGFIGKDTDGLPEENSQEITEVHEPSINWSTDTTGKYLKDDDVQCLICVQATSENCARVIMFEKSHPQGKNVWTKTLECEGYIGLNGLGKTEEGDKKTPIGDFGITGAFGIKEDPGTRIDYVDVTDNTWCCGDKNAYNQIIDIKDHPHECAGEHMIDCSPEYNYGLFIDYNKDCVPGLGSAIFLHCKGAKTYTGGCIAVDEECMVQILLAADNNTRIIIDYAADYRD